MRFERQAAQLLNAVRTVMEPATAVERKLVLADVHKFLMDIIDSDLFDGERLDASEEVYSNNQRQLDVRLDCIAAPAGGGLHLIGTSQYFNQIQSGPIICQFN